MPNSLTHRGSFMKMTLLYSVPLFQFSLFCSLPSLTIFADCTAHSNNCYFHYSKRKKHKQKFLISHNEWIRLFLWQVNSLLHQHNTTAKPTQATWQNKTTNASALLSNMVIATTFFFSTKWVGWFSALPPPPNSNGHVRMVIDTLLQYPP